MLFVESRYFDDSASSFRNPASTFYRAFYRRSFLDLVVQVYDVIFFLSRQVAVRMVRLHLLSTVIFILVSLPQKVVSWGKKGHEIVGNVAWSLLDNSTQILVQNVLNQSTPYRSAYSNCEENCSPLAQVADWADQARYTNHYHWSAPLHYIDVRDDTILPGGCHYHPNNDGTSWNDSYSCHFNYTRDCEHDFCVAGAIVNFTHQINTREGLMFLTHFVGDIHQPLHCSRATDRGGNSIHVKFLDDNHKIDEKIGGMYREQNYAPFLRRRHHDHDDLNLHAVWDDSIIDTTLARDYRGSRNAMEAEILNMIWKATVTPEWNELWMRCPNGLRYECTIDWGEESLEAALRYAYKNVNGSEILTGAHLSEDYYQTRLPIVKQRLALAGVRLATTIHRNLQVDEKIIRFTTRMGQHMKYMKTVHKT